MKRGHLPLERAVSLNSMRANDPENRFPILQNDLLLRAARREKTERTPVWIMRQAGRYLPEFRDLRVENDFFKVCRTPELACEVTLQPVLRYDLDAAIIFSDILVVPQAMGLEVRMDPGKGPVFPNPLLSPDEIDTRLVQPDVVKELKYVFDAISLTRHKLRGKLPLIGFSGAPWTLMAYMVEGEGSKTFSKAKAWLFQYPNQSRKLLQKITDVVVDYLVGQAHAGAQLMQVFDSWAGELGPDVFATFALPYLRQIADRVKKEVPEVPLVVFAKGANYAIKELAALNYDVIGLDWTVDPEDAKQVSGKYSRVALQGNLDPCVLYADEKTIRAHVRKMLTKFGTRGHIANLGHGLHPTHSPENVGWFIKAVHEISEEIQHNEDIEPDEEEFEE